MSITEKEVEEFTAEAGAIDWRDPIVLDWLRMSLESAQADEERLKAAFTFHRMMRNDERMQVALDELRLTRKALETLEHLSEKGNEG